MARRPIGFFRQSLDDEKEKKLLGQADRRFPISESVDDEIEPALKHFEGFR